MNISSSNLLLKKANKQSICYACYIEQYLKIMTTNINLYLLCQQLSHQHAGKTKTTLISNRIIARSYKINEIVNIKKKLLIASDPFTLD